MAVFSRSIHIKIIFWALLPIFLVMGGITFLSFVTIKNTALQVVQKRDAVLAEMTARRLSENLQKYPFYLQTLAETDPLKTMNLADMDQAVAMIRNWLHFFDGGIHIYDATGTGAWSYPKQSFWVDNRFPVEKGFLSLKTTLRPFFSNIISADPASRNLIVISVPIIGPDNAFKGAVAGICSVNYSTLGTTYTRILEYKKGKSSYAYLVDGNGNVLYHRHSSLIGTRFNHSEAVRNVTRGMTGAIVTRDISGEMVISGFSPVPGTGWGIVTSGNWTTIKNLIRFHTRLLLFFLWGGGTIAALLVYHFIHKQLGPIRDLTKGAEQISKGHFVKIPVKKTGDEIEVLSRQFNSMAMATKNSFENIKKQVIELNLAQKELKRSEEKISGIINAVKDVMLMVDETGNILWSNDKGRQVFGPDAEKSRYYEILYQQPEPPEDCIIRNCFKTGIEDDMELKILNKDELQDFWCTCNVVRCNRMGKVTQVVVVCRNLTEKKQLRAEVLRNAQLAALGELAAGIAHEINNPINGIINYAQIIQDSQGPEQAGGLHAHLPQRIIKEGERIALIVTKLLSLAKAGSEKKQPLLIREILGDVLDLTHTMLKKDRIHVDMHIPDDLPACRAVLHQVQQIFLNVISNARYALNQKQHQGASKKIIRIECSTLLDNDVRMIRTSFWDNGSGIPKDFLKKIGNPFFSTKPPDQGTGLGLSISCNIIEEHGGILGIRSIEGEWTQIDIDLPVW